MKKVVRIAGIIMFLSVLSGCFGYHRITIRSGKEYLVSCPARAKAGQIVTVRTMSVTDADMFVRVNGTDCEYVSDGEYRFVMPDEEVQLTIAVVSNGLA